MADRPHLFLHRESKPAVAVDAPWPGEPIAGDPHTVTLNGYASADGRLLTGVWESTPGTWEIDYQDWEYCHILEGRCVIRPEDGAPKELKAGDVFVIEPGLKGVWEVVETVRKYYVFHLSAPAPTDG
jgi:uncharacterized protein